VQTLRASDNVIYCSNTKHFEIND